MNIFEIRKNGEVVGSLKTNLTDEEVKSLIEDHLWIEKEEYLDLEDFIDYVSDLTNETVHIERFFFDSVIDI